MHRFFISPEELRADEVHLSTDTSRQISRVLRLKAGEHIVLLDNSGFEMMTELLDINGTSCLGRILGRKFCENEPHTQILMILSLTQRDKFEWMLQKCTEIGVSAFMPMITCRTLIQNSGEVMTKYERWNTIIKEAAEQSGRGIVPELLQPSRFEAVIKNVPAEYPLCLMPWENESQVKLKDILLDNRGQHMAIMIGPEGGFSDKEVEMAKSSGFLAVTLGKRILRMETAALVAAALVLHEVEGN